MQLFRADLISAMKIPDSMPMETGSYLTIRETWRTEWEIGVQVCLSVCVCVCMSCFSVVTLFGGTTRCVKCVV